MAPGFATSGANFLNYTKIPQASKVTEEQLADMKEFFITEPGYTLRLPAANELLNTTHEDEICVYADHFRLGLRFPLCDELEEILNFYGFILAQLMPNSLASIMSFIIFLRMNRIPWNQLLFRHFFVPSAYVDGMVRFSIQHMEVSGLEGKIPEWRHRYLFVKSSSPWSIPTKPIEFSLDANTVTALEYPLSKICRFLKERVANSRHLLSPPILRDALLIAVGPIDSYVDPTPGEDTGPEEFGRKRPLTQLAEAEEETPSPMKKKGGGEPLAIVAPKRRRIVRKLSSDSSGEAARKGKAVVATHTSGSSEDPSDSMTLSSFLGVTQDTSGLSVAERERRIAVVDHANNTVTVDRTIDYLAVEGPTRMGLRIGNAARSAILSEAQRKLTPHQLAMEGAKHAVMSLQTTHHLAMAHWKLADKNAELYKKTTDLQLELKAAVTRRTELEKQLLQAEEKVNLSELQSSSLRKTIDSKDAKTTVLESRIASLELNIKMLKDLNIADSQMVAAGAKKNDQLARQVDKLKETITEMSARSAENSLRRSTEAEQQIKDLHEELTSTKFRLDVSVLKINENDAIYHTQLERLRKANEGRKTGVELLAEMKNTGEFLSIMTSAFERGMSECLSCLADRQLIPDSLRSLEAFHAMRAAKEKGADEQTEDEEGEGEEEEEDGDEEEEEEEEQA